MRGICLYADQAEFPSNTCFPEAGAQGYSLKMADGVAFTIELEYDPVKNAQLGNSASKVAAGSEDSLPQDNLRHTTATNIQAGSNDSGRSYLSVEASTIQVLKPGQTMFVWHAYFHPGLRRRFQSVVLTCRFSEPKSAQPPSQYANQSSSPVDPLEIRAYAPHKSFGGCNKISRKVGWGIKFPLQVTGSGLVEVGATPSVQNETIKEVEHAFTVVGTPRGAPRRTTCVWTIEENSSTERGIPSEMQFATIIRHSGPIQCDIQASARTAGGPYPLHYLRTRTASEDRRRIIDPSKFAGKLFEYDFQSDADVDELLKTWAGEVTGAVLEFQQPIVKP